MIAVRRAATVTVIAPVLVVLTAVAALAFWKTTGSGTGTATAASSWTENTGTLTVDTLSITNGGSTPGKPETGDKIAVKFSGPIATTSVCSTWTTGTLTGISVRMGQGNGSNVNSLTVTGCSGNLRYGSLNVSPRNPYHSTNDLPTWGSSTLAWDSTSNTLTLTLGGTQTPATVLATPSTPPTWTYTPPASPNQITAPSPNTSLKVTGTGSQSTTSF